MIPVYRTDRMEPAVDVLCEHFRQVLVISSFYNLTRIRLKADLLKEKRVWFQGTKRQVELWHERGGVFMAWNFDLREGEHDAAFIVECPRSIEILDRMLEKTRFMAGVYIPPSWRLHQQVMENRLPRRHPVTCQRIRDKLARVIEFTETRPVLNRPAVRKLLAGPETTQSWSSSAPESPAGVEPPPGTSPEAP